jgi:hypothetical protein
MMSHKPINLLTCTDLSVYPDLIPSPPWGRGLGRGGINHMFQHYLFLLPNNNKYDVVKAFLITPLPNPLPQGERGSDRGKLKDLCLSADLWVMIRA